ncbi:MAG: SUKH-3 domain-containing protein [Ardenticatenales bacterium]|nr:SUKH-3 domain-containing protein [Ardenticatenales bacterium]
MNFPFSERTIETLRRAGWYPGRKIDISAYIDALEAEGYVVFPSVQAFLQEFSGLKLIHENEFNGIALSEATEFDAADEATHGVPIEAIQKYCEFLQSPLCMIGSISNKHAALLMTPLSHVYGTTGDNLVYWGSSAEEAIERLCTFAQKREIVILLDE